MSLVDSMTKSGISVGVTCVRNPKGGSVDAVNAGCFDRIIGLEKRREPKRAKASLANNTDERRQVPLAEAN